MSTYAVRDAEDCDLGHTSNKALLQQYANAQKVSLELTDIETGEITEIHPTDPPPTAYPFERTGVFVRVHPDDKPSVLEYARSLNHTRKGLTP